jgi:hypothetical protein
LDLARLTAAGSEGQNPGEYAGDVSESHAPVRRSVYHARIGGPSR